jgi:hypothetical protein
MAFTTWNLTFAFMQVDKACTCIERFLLCSIFLGAMVALLLGSQHSHVAADTPAAIEPELAQAPEVLPTPTPEVVVPPPQAPSPVEEPAAEIPVEEAPVVDADKPSVAAPEPSPPVPTEVPANDTAPVEEGHDYASHDVEDYSSEETWETWEPETFEGTDGEGNGVYTVGGKPYQLYAGRKIEGSEPVAIYNTTGCAVVDRLPRELRGME